MFYILYIQHYGISTYELEPQPVVLAELKLVSVPVVFLLLRIWSLILVLIEVEIGYDLTSTVFTFLLYMSVSVHKCVSVVTVSLNYCNFCEFFFSNPQKHWLTALP